MIIVTGGAGFIGSNIIKTLNKEGYTNILVVDNLKNGTKVINLTSLKISDYIDKHDFITEILKNKYSPNDIEAVFHQGACSSTTEWDGKYIMDNNYQYSKILLHWCLNYSIPFLYASSAAVYGKGNSNFIEDHKYEKPLNIYGYSKMLLDNYVRNILPKAQSQICGLRYFNVYGPFEGHKNRMASMVYRLNKQLNKNHCANLFKGSDKFKRDFIYVEDVVSINLWLWKHKISGIFNCGTGHASSFQEVATEVLKYHKNSKINYIEFPENLKGCYQQFTLSDQSKLLATGYSIPFKTITEGVYKYILWLKNNHKFYTRDIC